MRSRTSRGITRPGDQTSQWRFEFSSITGTCTWRCWQWLKQRSSSSRPTPECCIGFDPQTHQRRRAVRPAVLARPAVRRDHVRLHGGHGPVQLPSALAARRAAGARRRQRADRRAHHRRHLLSASRSCTSGRGALLLQHCARVRRRRAGARDLVDTLVDEDLFKRRVLVYGAGRRAGSIARLRRRSDRRGFVVVGYLAAAGDAPSEIRRDRQAAARPICSACAPTQRVDEIVVAMDDRRQQFPMDQLLECRLEGVEIVELVSFLERETGKVRLDILNPSWMIFSEGFRQGRIHATLERMFDIVASLVLLVLAAPLMLLTALAIKLIEGPRATIFYRQVRVGQYGKPFRLLKFRSMSEDAEADGKAQWAQKNDSRVTRIGAFIRLTRIDELPQILNVLRGEMSFVGPRPERPEFVARAQRAHSVLPRAPLDQAGHHRLGAAVLSVRLVRAGCDREAAVRSVLRQEPQPAVLYRDTGADRRSDRVGEGGALASAAPRTSGPGAAACTRSGNDEGNRLDQLRHRGARLRGADRPAGGELAWAPSGRRTSSQPAR